MKLNTLERVLAVLEKEDCVVELDVNTQMGALAPLDRMLELAE